MMIAPLSSRSSVLYVCHINCAWHAMQVVQVVIAGGLLRNAEALAAPTTHASFRQQNAVLAPVRSAEQSWGLGFALSHGV